MNHLRDFATTLTCLAATPEQLIVGQLGDGAVVARGADGILDTVTTLQRGEYANETYFLTQEQALEQVDHPGDQPADASSGGDERRLDSPGFEATHQRTPPAVFRTAVCFCRSVGIPQ